MKEESPTITYTKRNGETVQEYNNVGKKYFTGHMATQAGKIKRVIAETLGMDENLEGIIINFQIKD